MRRYLDIAITTIAGIIFAPVALWFICLVAALAFFIGTAVLAIVFALTYHLAGAAGVVIVALGIIAAAAFGIYKLIEGIRTSRFLKQLIEECAQFIM